MWKGWLMKRLAIGADHRGFTFKEFLVQQQTIAERMVQWVDVGADQAVQTDYPHYAFKVVKKILAGEADAGILLCGTGVGMSMAANRFKRIYAALVWNTELAKRAREEDDANVLVLPADYLNQQEVLDIVGVWLTTDFLGEHYQNRLRELDMF